MNRDDATRWCVLTGLAALYAVALWPAAPVGSTGRADPLSPPLRSIELALRDQRPADALELARAVARQYPREPFLKYLEATSLQHLERWAEEAHAWEAYAAMSDTPGAACPAVAVARQRAGDSDGALGWYRRCAAFEPDEPDRLIELAEALVGRGEMREAQGLFRKVNVLDPGNPAVREALALMDTEER